MPYRVEKKRDDYFAIIYFHKWEEGSTLCEIGAAKTLAEAEAIRDNETEFENIVSSKLDVAFTELRVWLEEKGRDKEIDNQTLLNGIDTWLHAKRIYLLTSTDPRRFNSPPGSSRSSPAKRQPILA